MKILPSLCAVALTLGLSTFAQAQNGGAAVLDIDKVAQDLGIDQSVLTELQQIEANLNNQLAQVRGNLQTQMNQLEARAGQQPTPEVQAQLLEANRKLNADFNQVRVQAQNQLAAARIERINEFRDKLRPIALEAAKAKGLQVVLTLTPQVYANDESVDITADVIKAAIEAGLKQEAPAPAATPTTDAATPTTEAVPNKDAAAPEAPAAPKPAEQ